MKHVWSSIGGVTVVLVSILVFACDNATPVASDPGLEVDPVDRVTLPAAPASVEDFGTLPSTDYTLVSSKTEALELFSTGAGMLFDYLEVAGEGWEPSAASTFTLEPENLFELTEPPTTMSASGQLVDETIGDLFVDAASADGSLSLTWDANDMPTTVTGRASAGINAWTTRSVAADPVENVAAAPGGSLFMVIDSPSDTLEAHLVAAMAAAVDARMGWNSDGTSPRWVEVAYAVSARASAAMTVATTVNGTPLMGNLIATVSYDGQLTLDLTEDLLADEAALENYLEENVGTGSLTLSLAVYDGDGTLQDTYSFGFSDLSVSAF